MRLFKNKKDEFVTIIIILFNCSLLLRHYVAKTTTEINAYSLVALLIGMFLLFYTLSSPKNRYELRWPLVFYFILYFFGVLSSLFTTNYEIQNYLIPFQYFGVGIALLSVKLSFKITRVYYYSIVMLFIVNIAKGTNPALMFNISRNYVSVVILTTVILYYFSMYQNKRNITLMPAIISFIICFWSVGRSGIVASGILLIGTNLYINLFVKASIKKIFIQAVIILTLLYLSWYYLYDVLLANTIVRFENQGFGSGGRNLIWGEYYEFAVSNVKRFIFGVSYKDTNILNFMSGNPHNAFIQLHMGFGLGGLILVSLKIIFNSIKLLIKEKFLLVILVVILIRIFTDSGAFSGPFDPFIYYLIFYKEKS